MSAVLLGIISQEHLHLQKHFYLQQIQCWLKRHILDKSQAVKSRELPVTISTTHVTVRSFIINTIMRRTAYFNPLSKRSTTTTCLASALPMLLTVICVIYTITKVRILIVRIFTWDNFRNINIYSRGFITYN